MTLRGDQGRKHHHESLHSIFSKMYGGSRAGKGAGIFENEQGSYDFDEVAVDTDGLPLTSSDLHLAVKISQSGSLHLLEAEKEAQREQSSALSLLYEAAQVMYSLPSKHSQDHETFGYQSHVLLPSHSEDGLSPMEELNLLRQGVANIAEAFDYADPSRKGRLARKSTSTASKSGSADFRLPTLKRKPVPECSVTSSVNTLSSESHDVGEVDEEIEQPEQKEELTTFDSSLSKSQASNAKSAYQARALRRLEVHGVTSSSSDEASEEEINIAQYYIAKHRASRKNEVQCLPRRSSKRDKAVRRTTSILDNKDEMKNYLLKSGSMAQYQCRSKNDFVKGLNEAHRHTSAPPVPTIKAEFLAREHAEDSTCARSSMSSEEGGEADQSLLSLAISAFHLSSDSMQDGDTSTPPCSDVNDSRSSRASTLSTSPSSRSSSLYFTSSDDDNQEPTSKSSSSPAESDLKVARLDFQPTRPKRHPGRGKATLAVDRRQNDAIKSYSGLPSPCIVGQGVNLHTGLTHPDTSLDVTPRPGALGFDPDLFCRLE
ncbi:hypothetical protein CBS101457_005293 [Exobasidium rhododendri]|nr:hypothetical protein CBS101457_005293 [Exobasidium rhododendri]